MTAPTPDTPTRKVTLADVSRLAGCSKGVVSAVVNGARGNIAASPATRERVLAAARRLGYRPNFASQSLARRSTQTIGIYVPPGVGASLGYSYEGRIVRGVEQACRERGYDLLVINLAGGVTPDQCGWRFAEGRVDGLLLLHVPHDADWVAALAQAHRRVAAVNYYGPVLSLASVVFDDATAVRLAVRHLAGLGHRRIGYLGAVDHDLGPGGARRAAGFRAAVGGLDLEPRPAWLWDHSNRLFRRAAPVGWSPLAGRAGADYFLSLGEAGPTAVVCHDDQLAAALVQRLAERGVRVPQQLSVVGIDDADIAARMFPPLTSVRQPLEQMGHRAATLVLDAAHPATRRARGKGPLTRRELWPPELQIRQSSAAPDVAAVVS